MFTNNRQTRISPHTSCENALSNTPFLKKRWSLTKRCLNLLVPLLSVCYSSSAVSLPASNLRLVLNGGTVMLTWTGSSGVVYQVEGASSPAGPWLSIGAPTTNFTVTTVISAPSQVFRVGIFTNTTEYVANAARSAGDKAAPTIPGGLVVSAPACNQVTLSWAASTDQVTKVGGTTYTSGLKGYNVYRGGAFLKQVLAPTTGTTDTSVSGSVSYSYRVAAIDNLGNASSPSTAVNVTTPPCQSCVSVITVTPSPAGSGTVSGGGTVNCGTSVTVSAAAISGYNFVSWTENGIIVSTASAYAFSANANRALVANFTPVSTGGLKGRWTFDTATVSGSTATDSSGNANNATLVGNPLPTIVPGKTNQAV